MRRSSVGFKRVLLVAVIAGVVAAGQAGAATATSSASLAKKSAGHGGGVSSHIVLPAVTLVAGATERGTLVIGNSTGHTIHWDCAYLEVQLTNAHWPLRMHPTPCSSRGETFRVGTTRLRFTLWASYSAPDGTWKPLPPGTYRTQLLAAPNVVHPNPITVHVVAKRK
jgi:hypothetical protein